MLPDSGLFVSALAGDVVSREGVSSDEAEVIHQKDALRGIECAYEHAESGENASGFRENHRSLRV